MLQGVYRGSTGGLQGVYRGVEGVCVCLRQATACLSSASPRPRGRSSTTWWGGPLRTTATPAAAGAATTPR
eukprot:734945-Prorocentrum_minimum.AAC.2